MTDSGQCFGIAESQVCPDRGTHWNHSGTRPANA